MSSSSNQSQQVSLQQVIAEVNTHLRQARVFGLPNDWFVGLASPVQAEAVHSPSAPESVSESVSMPASSTSSPLEGDDWSQDSRTAKLRTLETLSQSCTKCRLCETRKNVVFGVGHTVSPQIAFVGEGPGADEDRVGEPFVGKAGMLLTAAITKGLGLQRSEVYICNVVKCRPPENRTPLPDEVAACSPYLFEQLELIRPKVIIALGGPAMQTLTGVQGGITKLRGKWLEWKGIKVMPTFHPAYILRNPPAKKDFWEDLQQVMRELGLPAA